MNQNDISAILPQQGIDQPHYIHSAELPVHPLAQQSSYQYTLPSSQFPGIFYCKRSMKSLLQERSLISEYLKLKLKPSSSKKIEPEIPLDDMYEIVAELFKQSPTQFDPLHFVFIFDYGNAYGFFSGDGKFVPMCKKCNFSIHVVIKTNNIKIVCCNPKCKTKILGDRPIFSDDKNSNKNKNVKASKMNTVKSQASKSQSLKVIEEKKRQLTQEELNLIRKTAKKITYA